MIVKYNTMKLFLCTWGHNYGLGCCIIAAKDKKQAELIAESDPSGTIWDGFELNEIVTPDKEGIIDIPFYQHT